MNFFATGWKTLLRCPIPGFVPKARFPRARLINNIPFQDDLTPMDDDLFNLEDFQEYKEAPDVLALKRELGIENKPISKKVYRSNQKLDSSLSKTFEDSLNNSSLRTFDDYCNAKESVVFISKLLDPYLNLAIEDHIFKCMRIPEKGAISCNRLLFYVNSPCVVIGKNQNPWKEVNLPLLTNLRLPLIRRRSGGGTVVHDSGNVNFSFMTTRDKFDRLVFANLVTDAVNSVLPASSQVMVNERGDIVTENDQKKVSGSAYKISKGKSYHHGTMLLNSRLDVLRQLLHRDESLLGTVNSQAAVTSVKSCVSNLEIDSEVFIKRVTAKFQDEYGIPKARKEKSGEKDAFDQTELLGLDDLVSAFAPKTSPIYEIDKNCQIPDEIINTRKSLMQWEWKYGATPKFLHHFENSDRQTHVQFDVGQKAQVTGVQVQGSTEAVESFKFLKEAISNGSVSYTGSSVAGYVLDDKLSEWIGRAIDGTS